MTRIADTGTDLAALLAAASANAGHRKKLIEPHLQAREAAAEEIANETARLVMAWHRLSEHSRFLVMALHECGIAGVPPAHIDDRSLSAAVATELWRLTSGPHPGSPLALPCVCGGQVNRPDMLKPLADAIRDANTIVRGLLA